MFLVLLLSTLLSACSGSGDCFKDAGAPEDCRVKAEQGNARAQFRLGNKYKFGLGVARDDKEANKWIRLAAEQGYARAQYVLGNKYKFGRDVAQDGNVAAMWYRLAAEQGYPYAQFNLGFMYTKGQAVPQDYVMANMYWNIAGASGYDSAVKNRGIIEKKMTPSQVAEAQKLAREWVKTHPLIEVVSMTTPPPPDLSDGLIHP